MKNLTIKPDQSIISAMKKLELTGERSLIVVTKSSKFLGTLTDGDIRRAILKGLDINKDVTFCMNKNPIISKKANEFTGSFRIEALVENPAMDILAGLPARLFISMEETLAHLVPASSILLSDNGNTIVKVVKNGIVNSKEVSVLGESESGFWISGLPAEISVITVGQNYVVTGDHVNVNITNN